MEILSIKVLNSKGKDALRELEAQQLIEIEKKEIEEKFWDAVEEIREKGRKYPISLEEITEEVEKVRAERYEAQKNSH